MPLAVLSKQEIEEMIKKRCLQLLQESEIREKISFLERELHDMRVLIEKLDETLPDKVEALKRDLGEIAELIDIQNNREVIIVRPRHWLKEEEFKTINGVVTKLGGLWVPHMRAFSIRK